MKKRITMGNEDDKIRRLRRRNLGAKALQKRRYHQQIIQSKKKKLKEKEIRDEEDIYE
jgi:hypothetical protein